MFNPIIEFGDSILKWEARHGKYHADARQQYNNMLRMRSTGGMTMTLAGGGGQDFIDDVDMYLSRPLAMRVLLSSVSDLDIAEVYFEIKRKYPGEDKEKTRQDVIDYLVELEQQYFTIEDAKKRARGDRGRFSRLIVQAGSRKAILILNYMRGKRTEEWPDDVDD